MSMVIALISQKGGVGKSTLARGLATFAVRSKLGTTVADLDVQQKTVSVWEKTRARHGLKPVLDIASFNSVKDAVVSAKEPHVLVLDMAGKITDGASEASEYAHLLVQPTSPSADDLHISVLVFLAMERIDVPREKLAFALCRVLRPLIPRELRLRRRRGRHYRGSQIPRCDACRALDHGDGTQIARRCSRHDAGGHLA
jgi:chromosome partitioning protein